MACRTAVVLSPLALMLGAASPVSGQTSRQDALRRLTAEEYHAVRGQWLEARRAGLIAPPAATYGSAVVGPPADEIAAATPPTDGTDRR